MEITREKWDGYVAVQKSGLTNMWAIDVVINLAAEMEGVELTQDDCFYIMKHYAELRERFEA